MKMNLKSSILFSLASSGHAFQFHASTKLPISIRTCPSSRLDVSSAGRRSCSRCSLSMHMGHSHSHHHHHDHSHSESSMSALKQPIKIRRKVTRILFAALATLLPPLLLRKSITKTNFAIFLLTSTTLSFTERLRSEVKFFVNKAKNIRDGFIKHAPPSMNASKYLFANDNAADRVTLVGVLVNLLLSIGKAIVGVTCHSNALVADAGHSLSDLFSDFITLWAVQIARLPPDDDVSDEKWRLCP